VPEKSAFSFTFTSFVGLNLRTQCARFHAKSSAKYTFFENSVKLFFASIEFFFLQVHMTVLAAQKKGDGEHLPFLPCGHTDDQES
jgi:hypothetical protein